MSEENVVYVVKHNYLIGVEKRLLISSTAKTVTLRSIYSNHTDRMAWKTATHTVCKTKEEAKAVACDWIDGQVKTLTDRIDFLRRDRDRLRVSDFSQPLKEPTGEIEL